MGSSPNHPAPPPHACPHDQRIDRLEARADVHDIALTDGKIEFASIKKDLASIQATLAKIEERLEKVGNGYGAMAINAAIFWIVPLIGGGILYSIFKSGGIPGAHP